MAAIENEKIYGLQIRESANDGSDFTNPAADYRLAFLGEDGLWHLKDSAGAVTTPGGGIADQGNFTYLDATEAAAPGTPAAGKARIYAKADGRFYSKDDAGTEFGPFDAAGGGGSSGYVAAITGEADIVQYWPLNEAHGATTFNDVIGGTDLTVNAGTVGTGGPSLTGDTTAGGSVILGFGGRIARSAITWPAAWSIEAWLFIGNSGTDIHVLGQWDGAGAMVYMSSPGSIRIYSGGTFTTWSPVGGAADIIGLHHVVLTHDGTTERLWWDGVNVVSQTIGSPTGTAGGDFDFNGGGTGPLTFAVSDVAIYDVALDSTKINDHYALGT